MKVLLLADVECKALWDFYRREELEGIDLILSCGDLNAEYLSFLATMASVPRSEERRVGKECRL